jgi:hypothetical protein
MDFSKDDISAVIRQAGVLQDEIEALKYSVNSVPFEEKLTSNDVSLIEMVALIDHAQETYYKPLVENLRKKERSLVTRQEHFTSTFVYEPDPEKTVEEVLNRVIKHRAAFLSYLEKLPVIDWDRSTYMNGKRMTIFDLLIEMTQWEKEHLRKIAEIVMTHLKR